MPQMSPCWWMVIQFFSMVLLLMVFVEIYYSLNFKQLGHLKSKNGLTVSNSTKKISIKVLLNE